MSAEICNHRRQVIGARAVLIAMLSLAGVALPIVEAKESHTAQADALFSGKSIPKLSIEISNTDMDFLRTQKRTGASGIARTSVDVTVREGTVVHTNVALHMKGSASFRAVDSKPGLTLSFDKNNGDQRFHGLQKISLNNSVQDASLLCEMLGRELFTAAGIPVPRVTHVQVELNGSDLGVYLLVEGWNKQFLKHHFADATGDLYERGNGRDVNAPLVVKSGDDPDNRRALKALADAALEPDLSKRWAALPRTLDLDRFISGMAMEIMIGHWDGYCRNQNNFRIFHDRAKDRMVFMPHGMDQLFGIRHDAVDQSVLPKMSGLVAISILETPEGRGRYLARLEELRTTVYRVQALTNRVIETASRLRPLLENEPSELKRFDGAVRRLLDRIPQRFETVGAQMKAIQTPLPAGGREVVSFTRWEQRREVGNPGFTRTQKSGVTSLQINGNGSTNCVGSYRAIYLLEPGRYRFEGHGMAENIIRGTNNGPVGVIGLRTSESTVATSVSDARSWTNLTHEFTVSATRYVDLICEYQGNKGKAIFDPLTLTRLPNLVSPPRTSPVERRGALDKR